MNKPDATTFNLKLLPVVGIALAAIFWVTDVVIDVYLFDEGNSFYENLFSPEPVELWMRCLVVVLLFIFSLYARKLLIIQNNISMELTQYKNQLERLVEGRTSKLEKTNTKLQEEIKERKKAEKELEHLAAIDPLTLLYNRRKFDELLGYEMERDKRYRQGLSVIFCDIDHFKKINDMHGHDVGDECSS